MLLRAPTNEDPQKWACVMTGWEMRSTNVFERSITGLINAIPCASELNNGAGELFGPPG